MLKTIAQLEMNVEGRIVHLLCDNDCPLSHLKEALFQFQKYIGQIEDSVRAQQEQESQIKSECNATPDIETPDPTVEG